MNLSKEEIEKAKANINDYIHDWLDSSTNEDGYEINSIDDDSMSFINNIETLLQYIQELEVSNKELDKENNRLEKIEFERDIANKVIDEMADKMAKIFCINKKDCIGNCNKCIKQYFVKKVEGK